MLDAGALANAIISNMEQASNPNKAHTNFGNALKNYLTNSLEIKGTYYGVIGGGNADPLNGVYKWKLADFQYNTSNMLSSAQSGFNTWKNAFLMELSKIKFLGSDTTQKVTTTVITELAVLSINIDMSSKPNNMPDAMLKVAEGIVQALKIGIPMPLTVGAYSITPTSSGMVTWGAIE